MSFKDRIKATKKTRWIRFGIVSIIFFLWVIWLGNPWVALAWILLFDIYITGYIPFSWWKSSPNKHVRSSMAWVDAIVYALVIVYFAFAFIGQNYQIPSSSLEKTLLTGDYLFVNKTVYGPRVPMTPIHFPLVHNELPFGLGKSYSESLQLPYHRLKGLRSVEQGDIVVFNFPAGDTIMSKVQNPDYYTLLKTYGRTVVTGNKEVFGDVVYRPVDRRENYVKRCVGLPGQRLKIVDGVIYNDGVEQKQPENVQFNYAFQASRPISDSRWKELGVALDDVHVISTTPLVYALPMTQSLIDSLKASGDIVMEERIAQQPDGMLFPEGISNDWTIDNYGGADGILIPARGMKLKIDASNWPVYERAIRVYENNPTAHIENNRLVIDGNPVDTYEFKMDYYFMMGDNRHNSLDSRYWGFVPEDHVVGTPWRVLISFDKDRSFFDGKIRFSRIFKDANPDKD